MHKRFLFWDNPKDAVLVLTFLLMTIGAINVFSASFVEARETYDNGYHFLFQYVRAALVGLVPMALVGWYFNYRTWLRFRHLWYAIFLVVLVCVDLFGVTSKGAQRWLYVGSQSVQPSEFVKLSIILLGAGSLGEFLHSKKPASIFRNPSNIAFFQAGAFALLVFLQPDMGTAAIIFALMVGLYIVAGLPKLQLVILLGASLAAAAILVAVAPYRLARVKIWFDPWQDAANTGYQVVQALTAIGSGGFFGTSFGLGTGKFFYLPEAHTDFAFAIFCQEWGFLGASFLIMLFLLLAAAIHRIALNTKSASGFLLVTGVNFLIVGQAVANMAMVCGLLPVIGVPLSFISYGGTALIANMIAIGLVVAVYRDETGQESAKQEVAAVFEQRKQELANKRTRPRGWRP